MGALKQATLPVGPFLTNQAVSLAQIGLYILEPRHHKADSLLRRHQKERMPQQLIRQVQAVTSSIRM
jgi:hypothetical protein